MSEALEKWELELFNSVVPKLGEIICRINDKLNAELRAAGVNEERRARMQIVADNTIHMARLAVYVSSYVNGVARIHTEILKNDVFRDWYEVYPRRFQNKTNGITQRRWLGLCNPELAGLIAEQIGDGFLTDLNELGALREKIDDDLIARFNDAKHQKKRQLAAIIKEREGVELPTDFVFDIQVKRMHEYKRQLLNAFWIFTSPSRTEPLRTSRPQRSSLARRLRRVTGVQRASSSSSTRSQSASMAIRICGIRCVWYSCRTTTAPMRSTSFPQRIFPSRFRPREPRQAERAT